MRKIIFILIAIAFFFIIQGMFRGVFDLWQKKELVEKVKNELEEKVSENKKLKYQLKIAESEEFIEKEARNKLLMVKDGEKEIVIDEGLLAESDKKEGKKEDKRSNPQKWWDLFF